MTVDARAGRRPGRPPAVVAAVVLLCAVWLAGAVLVAIVVADVPERAATLRRLGAILGDGGASATRLWLKAIALVVLLLVAAVLLWFAVPGVLQGRQSARIAVWVGVPLLLVEPAREVARAIRGGAPDPAIVIATVATIALALLAVFLLALPSVTAYVRAQAGDTTTA
jgi:hypothetical protein